MPLSIFFCFLCTGRIALDSLLISIWSVPLFLLIGIGVFSFSFSIRNDKRYRRRGTGASASQAAAAYDSSSVEGGGGGAGLSKSYRQAWDNLRDPVEPKRTSGGVSKSSHHHRGKETMESGDPNYRTRVSDQVRDEGEMVVSDVYPKTGKHHHADKKRHHHHHHHSKHGGKRNSGADWWNPREKLKLANLWVSRFLGIFWYELIASSCTHKAPVLMSTIALKKTVYHSCFLP